MLLLSLFDNRFELGSIIFLRHGQAKNNLDRVLSGRTPGVPLTDDGLKQAQSIAKFLKQMNISAIYSSPIDRAVQTAKIVAKKNSLDYFVDDRLIEIDMGKFTGMKYDDIFSSHGNVFLKFYQGEIEIAHNGVETFAQVKKRVLDMVEHITTNHENQNVVLVTHMDPIKSMLSTVMDLSPKALFELIIANGSLTIFRNEGDTMSLKALNVMEPPRFDQLW